MERLKLWLEKFGEAWTACALCMVQGDLSVFTLNHAITASKTGTLTGFAILVASFLPWSSPMIGIWLTGLFTAIADIIVHPSHFGPEWMESVVTGFGAMMLAFLFQKVFKK